MASRLLHLLLITLILCLLGVQSASSKEEKYKVLKGEWCGKLNCYDILGVSPDVEFRDIKAKYNNLSLSLHPDKNPDQSDADKERYVQINKAYEILSSKRHDYDEYLRIKVSMDSPKENIVIVMISLYLILSYAVLYFQRKNQEKVKEAILKNAEVVRYYWDKKKIDLTGKRKEKKSPRSKGRNKKKAKPQDVKEIVAKIDVDEINEVLAALNMRVSEWRDHVPTYKSACWDVASSVTWALTETLFRARWALKYTLLKQDYSQDDREHLCMKFNKMTDEDWEVLSEQKRKELMSKKGPWQSKKKQ